MMNQAMRECWNADGKKDGYPYTVYLQTDDVRQFKYLRDFYKYTCSTIRELLKDGYTITICSGYSWRIVRDEKTYLDAINERWAFHLDNLQDKLIEIEWHK